MVNGTPKTISTAQPSGRQHTPPHLARSHPVRLNRRLRLQSPLRTGRIVKTSLGRATRRSSYWTRMMKTRMKAESRGNCLRPLTAPFLAPASHPPADRSFVTRPQISSILPSTPTMMNHLRPLRLDTSHPQRSGRRLKTPLLLLSRSGRSPGQTGILPRPPQLSPR